MSNLNTLLVEDNLMVREGLIGALEDLATVEVVGIAEDEESAVEWLRDHRCDLVIIDVFLKSGSGLGVLQYASALGRKMTLVVLSNYATPAMRRRCLDLGATKVFDKSRELDELVEYCVDLADP